MPDVQVSAASPALPARIACIHCGTPFKPTQAGEKYCCSGCEFVHALIEKNGLQQFYELREGAVPPVGTTVFARREFEWIRDLQKKAEERASQGAATLMFGLQGVSCIGCVWLIEKLFSSHPGGIQAQIDSHLGRLTLRWRPGECDLAAFATRLHSFGYLVGPMGVVNKAQDGLLTRMGICGALAMNVMLFSVPAYLGMEETFPYAVVFNRLAIAFSTLSLLVGGAFFFRRAFQGIIRGIVHIDLPISLGLLAAFGGSLFGFIHDDRKLMYFDFVANFTFFMLLGRWLQTRVVASNRHRILDARGPVRQLRVLLNHETNEWREIKSDGLKKGDEFELKSGEVNPVSSALYSEEAEMGLEWISGESLPRLFRRGQTVPAGTVSYHAQPLRLRALEDFKNSALASMLNAQVKEDPSGYFVQRIIIGAILFILMIAGLGAWAWLAQGATYAFALQVFISVLVVSCPCALGVAIPLADEMAAVAARAGGVFVREGSVWRRLRQVRNVVFDKTGTLTLENLVLEFPQKLQNLTPEQREALYLLVAENVHPAASAVREALLSGQPGWMEKTSCPPREVPGIGVELEWQGTTWSLRRPNDSQEETCQMVFAQNGQSLAELSFRDVLRDDSRKEIEHLQKDGLKIYLASGDRASRVSEVAEHLGLAEGNWRAEMLPEEKRAWIFSLGARETLMVGDGANDALAFDESVVCGAPLTSRGVLEQRADFFFVGKGLAGIRRLMTTAIYRRRAIRRAVGFGISYNVVAIALCLAGWMHPLVAAVLMPLSSIVAVMIVFRSQPPELFRSGSE